MLRTVSRASTEKRAVLTYVEVLKPLPSVLLTFIAFCAGVVADAGRLSPGLLLVSASVLLASAGANGLTNYLDRDIDARMERTRGRALASGRIYPPEKVLPLLAGLIIAGLVLAWQINPLVFLADAVGTLVAATWRKKVTCVYPQGLVASCAPLLMGWFAFRPGFGWEIVLICMMTALWLPLHVWSLIIANREDYLQAGLDYFPVSFSVRGSVKMLLTLSVLLYAASLALYFVGGFGWVYLAAAITLGGLMVYGAGRLAISGAAADAWQLYKLSSFPYLGLVFLAMCADVWLLG